MIDCDLNDIRDQHRNFYKTRVGKLITITAH